MIELGQKQTLEIFRKKDAGAYLGEPSDRDASVLLPKRQIPPNAEPGDSIEVFIYKDSEDRLIATTQEPKVMLGGLAVLKVLEVGAIGAFLDWGLEKDLLLPFKEQTERVIQGESCLVALYVDKSSRLCATMKVYDYLKADSPYEKDDKVIGIVYEIKPEMGAFVAVDNQYYGLIPSKELFSEYKVGSSIEARVTNVREDGKLNLSGREKAFLQMDADAESILAIMEDYNGILPFTDKVSPEIIKKEFNLSKNAFKRAIGRLLKSEVVKITETTIERLK